MVTKKSDLVLGEGHTLFKSKMLLTTPVEDLDDDSKVVAWSVIDLIEKKVLAGRKAELRDALLEAARRDGQVSSSGSCALKIAGGKVNAVHNKGKVSYDLEALRAVLKKKDIPESKCIQTVVTHVIDEDAIEGMIKLGMLDVEDLRDVTTIGDSRFSLRVTKPKQVTDLLEK